MPRYNKKMRREDLAPDDVLCFYCTGKCCRYFALPIDTPETREDFDHLRWYLMHGKVSIFVDDEMWYLMVHNECEHLTDEHLCGIYGDRPQICREYTTDECEYDDDECYELLFESAEQIREYAEALFPRRRRKSKRQNGRPAELPVLSAAPA